MSLAQKRVAKKKGAKRTSLGRSLEATTNSLQSTSSLGDITNLVRETILANKNGKSKKFNTCMELVEQVLPILERDISEYVVKACPKVGAGANYSVSRITSEEKK